MPGLGTEKTATPRCLLAAGVGTYLAGGRVINGSKSRDLTNTGDTDILQAGLLMGKITATKKYSPSIIGVLASAYNGGTSMTVSAAVAAEIVRRIGASGTLVVTGPATAGGEVRSQSIVFSAVNTTTGVITVTAADATTVQTVAISGTLSAGTFKLIVPSAAGAMVETADIAYNANIAAIQSAVDTALGSGKVTVGGTDVSSFTLTYGSDYDGVDVPLADVDTDGLTGETGASVTPTTIGSVGDIIAGGFVGANDGSAAPKCFVAEDFGIKVTDDDDEDIDVQFSKMLVGGNVNTSMIINYPTDAALVAWVKAQLRSVGHAYTFTDDFE